MQDFVHQPYSLEPDLSRTFDEVLLYAFRASLLSAEACGLLLPAVPHIHSEVHG